MPGWGVIFNLTSNKPAHYLIDYENYVMVAWSDIRGKELIDSDLYYQWLIASNNEISILYS